MLKLIRLETRKFKVLHNIKGVLITTLVLLGFLILIIFLSNSETDIAFKSFNEVVGLVNTMVNDVFLIFAAAMLAKVVIGEYSRNTISTLFTYPISRKKIIISKLLTVGIFMFLSMLFANIFLITTIYVLNLFFEVMTVSITTDLIIAYLIKILINSFSFSCMSSVCLLFGMRKKSTTATIVSSVIIVSIIGSSSNGFSLSDILIIPFSLAMIGLFLTYLSFRNIESVDVL